MFKWFIIHQWKEKTRAIFWQRNLWVYILFGFLLSLLTLNLFVVGLSMGKLLKVVFPDADPVQKFSELLIYYFLIDFIARFFYQGIPVMSVAPYLHLPIKRTTIFNFLLFKSLFNIFNWLPLLIIFPVAFKVVIPEYSVIYGLSWLMAIVLLIFTNNFLTLCLRQVLNRKAIFVALLLISAGAVIFLDYRGHIPLSAWFGFFVLKTASYPALLIVPAFALWIALLVSGNLIRKEAYLENITTDSGKEFYAKDRLSFLKRYGNTGALIRLELKLIWRNKRPKTYAFLSVFFVAYGFVFYSNGLFTQSNYMLVFIGTFLSSVFLLQYGQLLLAWESEHFDFILTRNISVREYYFAKYWLFLIAEVFSYILTLPFGLFNKDIVFVNFAMLLYNMGFSTFLVLYMSVYNTAPVTLNKGAFLNYEGIKGAQIFIIALLLLPVLIYMPFSATGFEVSGIFFLGIAGLSGILFREQLMDIVVNKFLSRKYKIAISFRND